MSGRPLDALSLLNINFLAALKALVEFAKGITNTVKHTFWYYTTSFEKQLKHWRLHIQSVTNRRAVLLRDMQLLNMPDSQGQRDFSRPEPEIAQRARRDAKTAKSYPDEDGMGYTLGLNGVHLEQTSFLLFS